MAAEPQTVLSKTHEVSTLSFYLRLSLPLSLLASPPTIRSVMLSELSETCPFQLTQACDYKVNLGHVDQQELYSLSQFESSNGPLHA